MQRSGYGLLYINGVYMGLYLLQEDIGSDFLDTRFHGDGSGNLMQLYYNVHLGYFGSDDTYYKERSRVGDLGSFHFTSILYFVHFPFYISVLF